MQNTPTHAVIGAILRNDKKSRSYKMALLRALNDIVLSFQDMAPTTSVAVPLTAVASYWLAYYWSFCDESTPILQGPMEMHKGKQHKDMAFRPELTALRRAWGIFLEAEPSSADGFFLRDEMRVPHRRVQYPPEIVVTYASTVAAIAKAVQMPIQFAGEGQWTVFAKPVRYREVRHLASAIPGTEDNDLCVVLDAALWGTFREMSMWIEALCIHEWSLFTQTVSQEGETRVTRGVAYQLLTETPTNRRPLTWERNNVDILLMEGRSFVCPWSHKVIQQGTAYDLDHIVPMSAYPINEMWNLVPSDPEYNMHVKRAKLPTLERLGKARTHLQDTYTTYDYSRSLKTAINDEVRLRFASARQQAITPELVANLVINFTDQVATLRNLPRF